ncbi:MAG: gamma-glutamylcyclotransferase family protein [Acidimicrobiia bacterium]
MGEHYTWAFVADTQLYFAYASLLDPQQLAETAPGARFLFSAHFPDTRLVFVANGAGPVASLVESPGSTVWGGVFEVPRAEVNNLVHIEAEEGRAPKWEMKAVDRAGNKHDCLTFVADPAGAEPEKPSAEYLGTMIRGARHWNLPAGWVVGLEDLADDQLLT